MSLPPRGGWCTEREGKEGKEGGSNNSVGSVAVGGFQSHRLAPLFFPSEQLSFLLVFLTLREETKTEEKGGRKETTTRRKKKGKKEIDDSILEGGRGGSEFAKSFAEIRGKEGERNNFGDFLAQRKRRRV